MKEKEINESERDSESMQGMENEIHFKVSVILDFKDSIKELFYYFNHNFENL